MIILDLKIEANTGQTNHINEFNKCKKNHNHIIVIIKSKQTI